MKAILKKSYIHTFLISLCVAMSGCSSKPSDGDGKQAVQNQITQDSQGRITLVEFHKSNGQLAEVNKVKLYNMEYEAEIEFSEPCRWLTDGSFRRNYTFRTAAKPRSNLNQTTAILDHINTGDSSTMAKGQRFKIAGAISFAKKEKGWSVVGVDLNRATPIAGTASPATEEQQAPQPSAAAPVISHAPQAAVQPVPNQTQADKTSDLEELEVTKALMQMTGFTFLYHSMS